MKNEKYAEILKNHYKPILISFAVGFILLFAASFLVKPLYKSVSVVFPVNLTVSTDESATEQLVQFFHSEDVMWQVIRKHNLFERYDVDTTKEKKWRSLIRYYYNQYVKISPTIYESVEISVKDTDPFYAREINQSILDITNNLIYERKKRLSTMYLNNFNIGLEKTIQYLKSNNEKDSLEKDKQEEKIQKYFAKSVGLGAKKIFEEIIRMQGDLEGNLEFMLVASSPSVNDKKVSPLRTLWGLLGGISAGFLYFVIVLYREKNLSS